MRVSDGTHCVIHGGSSLAVMGCKHVFTGKARRATIQLDHANRQIVCADCHNQEEMYCYCPACFVNRLQRFYPSIARQVMGDKWFAEEPI
jgi:hypothetical protein